MMGLLELGGILLLLAAGLRLAAFFTGNEAGFHRVSLLRLSLDARSGDRAAARLAWFAERPGWFVATALVGSCAGHLATVLAIGLLAGRIFSAPSAWAPLFATLALAPVMFVFCELAPTSVYQRAPLQMLLRDVQWFRLFFVLFAPVSLPLAWLARCVSKRVGSRPEQHLLGHTPLVPSTSHGRISGRLTGVQSRMIHGLIQTASQSVKDSMTPAGRVLGVVETATLGDVLDHARQYGLSAVPMRRAASESTWFGYLRVIDAAVTQRPPSTLIRTMPRIAATASKLEALIQLREAGALYGAVMDGEHVVGIVHSHGLAEQVFRPRVASTERGTRNEQR